MIMIASDDYFGPGSQALKFEARPALKAHPSGEIEILWFPVRAFDYSKSPVRRIMAATGAGAVALTELAPVEQTKQLLKVHQEVRRCLGLPFKKLAAKAKFGSKRRTPERSEVKVRRPVSINRKSERKATMEPPIDFLIITPLEEEREAMLAHLENPKRLPPVADDIRVYYPAMVPVTFTDGSKDEYKVVLTDLLQMGRLEAANAVGDAIRRWRPRYLILVGIAGGLAKAGVNVGDVLIADQVADYELQKLKANETAIRWSVHRASPALLAASKQLRNNDWQPLIREQRPGSGQPKRHSGVVCTGDKVIANSLIQDYQEIWTKLIGVEMEAGGAASASFQAAVSPGFFMVRGVSDLADPSKDHKQTESWRAYACDVAGAYTEAFLKSGPVVAADKAPQKRKPVEASSKQPPVKALQKWQEKLEFLESELVVVTGAAQKFEIKNQIEEARAKIRELGG
ncbi:MAG: hypothetical protein QOE77_916 [Blastocatellia bacterium]|nr:hypothetical protein [Blastocatellia bacterium]